MWFEIYESLIWGDSGDGYEWLSNGWWWRLKSRNGRIMADSGEGYATRSSCFRAINRLSVEMLHLGHRLSIREVES